MASDAGWCCSATRIGFQVDQVLELHTVELVLEDTQTAKNISKTVLHRALEYNTFDLLSS